MIRTNLSTRPFYNERIVRLWLMAIALVVLAATAFNVSRVLRYSRSDTRLATQASHDETRAADLHQQALRLRGSVDAKQVDYAAARYSEALFRECLVQALAQSASRCAARLAS